MSDGDDGFGQWVAPAQDGEILIWPEAQGLIERTRENQTRLSGETTRIQNVPLCELRREQRRWIGHAEDDRPLIATGHQIELYHSGVWAKDVLINEMARKLGGEAYHFAVDTDAPKHLVLRWPGGSGPITDDANATSADWAGLLEAPTPGHLRELQQVFAESAKHWTFCPLVEEFLSAMLRAGLESTSLTWALTSGMHEIDWGLGLRHHAMAVSPMWLSPGYLAMAHHVLSHADEFAATYNATLDEYRREEGIRDLGRPWPNLHRSDGSCEAPFWCDDLVTGQRSRASVERVADRWILQCPSGERFEFHPNADGREAAEKLGRFLAGHNRRLSPRAATLTAFLRLLVADQFTHGIGGGRYDRITDRVIERFFRLRAPAFSVTTATLLFPEALKRQRVEVGRVLVQGRNLRHRHDDPAKREMARRIAEMPRESADRRRLFAELHAGLAEAMKSGEYADWQRRLDDARRQRAEERDLFDRELFYAIQPRQRLEELMARYRQAMQ